MADLTRIETKPGPWNITTPGWPTYIPYVPNAMITSDTFAGGLATIPGRISDAGLGGSGLPWLTDVADSFKVEAGKLVPGSAAEISFAGFEHTAPDVESTIKLSAVPTVGNLWFDIWRAGHVSDGSLSAAGYRAQFDLGNTRFRTQVRNASGTVTGIPDTTFVNFALGQEIKFRLVGNTFTVLIDGTVAREVTDSTITRGPKGMTGFAKLGTTVSSQVSAVSVRRIDQP